MHYQVIFILWQNFFFFSVVQFKIRLWGLVGQKTSSMLIINLSCKINHTKFQFCNILTLWTSPSVSVLGCSWKSPPSALSSCFGNHRPGESQSRLEETSGDHQVQPPIFVQKNTVTCRCVSLIFRHLNWDICRCSSQIPFGSLPPLPTTSLPVKSRTLLLTVLLLHNKHYIFLILLLVDNYSADELRWSSFSRLYSSFPRPFLHPARLSVVELFTFLHKGTVTLY